MRVRIQDIRPGMVSGVEGRMPGDGGAHCEGRFIWRGGTLCAGLGDARLTGGVLRAFHHMSVFAQMEYHVDRAMFFSLRGAHPCPSRI